MNEARDDRGPVVDFSVLVSCYYEEESIDTFYLRLKNTMEETGRSYEIIFVNDGSTDRTFEKLNAIYEKDPKVVAIVDLMRNTGQANAKTPAVELARGKGLVLIDSDLQLDPEELPLLIKKFDEGFEVVTGYRKTRKDSFRRKLPSLVANMIMRRASGQKLRDFGCTFKIYHGGLVRAFQFDAFKPWRAIPVLAGARDIAEIPVSHHPRGFGKSGWTFKKLFRYNADNLVNVSEVPFQILGVACFVVGVLLFIRIAASFFWDGSILSRVTPGLIVNAIIGSSFLIVSVLSFIGELVIRTFVRLQEKPAYVIRTLRSRIGRRTLCADPTEDSVA